MSDQKEFAKYPYEVRSSTLRPTVVYTRLPGYYAMDRQPGDANAPERAEATMTEGESKIEVFREEADKRPGTAVRHDVRPVYTLQPGGTPAVPTGQVFIRLKEGVMVEERLQDIAQLGYEVTQKLEYAPHAAWLRARSGEIADALRYIPALEKIADVENVEPQMLMQRASR